MRITRLRGPLRTPAAVAAALALALTVAGCGADVSDGDQDKKGTAGKQASTSGTGGYPVTLTNCGAQVTYDKAPERVVTNDVGITEIMFALGLEDRMAGYVMPDDKGDLDAVPYKAAYEKVRWLSKSEINRELVLDAKADLVFAGWNYGFRESEGFTPAALDKLGVDTYLLSESCRNGRGKARGVMSPLDALYTDLRNLGKLFHVEDRAEKLIADYQRRIAAVQARAPKEQPRVFLYDDGRDKPLTSGEFAGPHDIITKAGGNHVMKDLKDSWVTVGWETVVDRDPEVIVINNYGDTSAEQKKKFLLDYPPLAGVSAIKNKRIFTLDYVDLVESPRNPAAIEALGAYLRGVQRG